MADLNFISTTGVYVPDTATIRTDVENEFKQIFGDDFVTDPETSEGALITSEVESRISVARNNAQLANQINPNAAGGTFFDSIWSLTGGQRTTPTRSTVQVVSTGVAGTIVPAGSRVATSDGDQWIAVSEFVIPEAGMISATFQASEDGPITLSPNSIVSIVDGILGWETATNTAAATPGILTETDVQARRKRRQELALQGRSTAEAVRSNLSATEGVRSFQFRENVSNQAQVIDGITLLPHSIWAAVDGGTNEAVANSLLEAKSSGSNWNGSQSVPVMEMASGQTFNVRFDRPTSVSMAVRITVRSTLGVAPQSEIVDAIIDYAQGRVEGEDGFLVGVDVSPFEVGAAVNSQIPGVFVSLVEVAESGANPSYSASTFDIGINQLATILPGDIEVTLL